MPLPINPPHMSYAKLLIIERADKKHWLMRQATLDALRKTKGFSQLKEAMK